MYYMRTFGTGYGRGGERCHSVRLWETRIKGIEAEEKTRQQLRRQSENLFDECHALCPAFNATVRVRLIFSKNGAPIKVIVSGNADPALSNCVEKKALTLRVPSQRVLSATLEVGFISSSYAETEEKAHIKTPPPDAEKAAESCARLKNSPTTSLSESRDDPGGLQTAPLGNVSGGVGEGIGLGNINSVVDSPRPAPVLNSFEIQLQLAFKAHREEIQNCFNVIKASVTDDPPKRISVTFGVTRAGKTKGISFTDPIPLAPKTAACFENIVKSIRFPRLKKRQSRVHYTFKAGDE